MLTPGARQLSPYMNPSGVSMCAKPTPPSTQRSVFRRPSSQRYRTYCRVRRRRLGLGATCVRDPGFGVLMRAIAVLQHWPKAKQSISQQAAHLKPLKASVSPIEPMFYLATESEEVLSASDDSMRIMVPRPLCSKDE